MGQGIGLRVFLRNFLDDRSTIDIRAVTDAIVAGSGAESTVQINTSRSVELAPHG